MSMFSDFSGVLTILATTVYYFVPQNIQINFDLIIWGIKIYIKKIIPLKTHPAPFTDIGKNHSRFLQKMLRSC